MVQRFYNLRRAQLKDPKVLTNKAHEAMARLEAEWEGNFLLVTQNVDNLHRRAGSKNLRHMHGRLHRLGPATVEVDQWVSEILSD